MIRYQLEIQAFPGLWTPATIFDTREAAEAAGNESFPNIPCWRVAEITVSE